MSGRPAHRGLRVALLSGAPVWRGSSAVYAAVAGGLAARGHETLVFVNDAGVAKRMAHEGARARHVPMRDTDLAGFARLRAELAELRPHLVMVDRPRDLRLAAAATLGWPTRLVYRYNLAHREYPGDLMSTLALWRVTGIVFPSRAIARQAFARTPRLRGLAWAVVPNGVDVERFHPGRATGHGWRRAHDIPDSAGLVLLPAAIERGKGHDLAIAALASLAGSSARPLVLACAGSGRLAAQVAAQARDAGLEARFPGALSTEQLCEALAAADVVVHPSDMETFGMSVAEAMAFGRPVVATAVGGVPEVTGRGGGAAVLVPPNDAAALAHAVARLLADPARRAALGQAARRRIVTRFHREHMLDRYERWFARLVAA